MLILQEAIGHTCSRMRLYRTIQAHWLLVQAACIRADTRGKARELLLAALGLTVWPKEA